MSVNVSTAFDANYYRDRNPDLASFNDIQARQHFFNSGLAEGRQFSPFIDLNWYRSNNSDLRNLSNSQLFFHLLNNGVREGRRFSPYVDIQFYKQVNSDLANLSNERAFEHLINSGINEGRQFAPNIDILYYKEEYPDLANLSNKQAFEHLINFGISEGRSFFPPANTINPEVPSNEPNFPNGSSLQEAIEQFARTDPGGPYLIIQEPENQENKLLLGTTAAEIISGGSEQDILIGYRGNDVFFLSPENGVNDPDSADIILDYNKFGDRIAITGGLALADLSFTSVQRNFNDLQQISELNAYLSDLNLRFRDFKRLIYNMDRPFIRQILQLAGIDESIFDLLLESGISVDSIDPNRDERIEGLAININGGDRTLGIVLNATVADVRSDLIFL